VPRNIPYGISIIVRTCTLPASRRCLPCHFHQSPAHNFAVVGDNAEDLQAATFKRMNVPARRCACVLFQDIFRFPVWLAHDLRVPPQVKTSTLSRGRDERLVSRWLRPSHRRYLLYYFRTMYYCRTVIYCTRFKASLNLSPVVLPLPGSSLGSRPVSYFVRRVLFGLLCSLR
jgi:hypothetical protein